MPDEPFDLHKAFLIKQEVLRTHLEMGRTMNTHPGTMGDASELRWKEMLREVLPGRYQVSKGFVVDSVGMRSEQIDVIVHDLTYSPLWWEDGGYLYVPAESVYAVFEVKQDHNLTHIGVWQRFVQKWASWASADTTRTTMKQQLRRLPISLVRVAPLLHTGETSWRARHSQIRHKGARIRSTCALYALPCAPGDRRRTGR